jgi:gas vesicle protein
MKIKDYVFYGIIVAFIVLFLAAAIVFNVFNVEILPIQFYGALIGVFITAIITAFLLRGQTEGDEKREKSLKVFETQKEKYNNFINEMWKIWDKRSVRLEEVNELLRMVSQDIVLYTKPKTVNEILSHLTQIAEYANCKESDNTDEFSKKIQEHIFSIINSLAKEINLGGEINDDVTKKLNALEDKLLPYINSKKYVKTLNELVRSKIKNLQEFVFEPDETSGERNVLWWHIDKEMWLRVGDQWGNGELYFAFWAEFYGNRQYQEYRYRVKGAEKDWMKVWRSVKDFAQDKYVLNFNDFRNGKPLPSDALENLANYIAEFFSKEYDEFDKKNIIGLIAECNK